MAIESVAYEFGSNKGMIQYMYPPGKQPDTEEDSIALGFITTKSDAVLLRIESSTTQDYMELEIVSVTNKATNKYTFSIIISIWCNDCPLLNLIG